MKDLKLRYKIDDRPPLFQSIILAIQHILAAFNGIVAVPIIVGGALLSTLADKSYYISAAIFCAGLVTIIQTTAPLRIGSRLPCVMGTSFTFVSPCLAAGKAFGIAAMLVGTAVGSIVEITASFFVPLMRRLFPRVVTSSVVTLIGLTLIPVAMDWVGGGYGAADYGSLSNLGVAIFVIAVILIFNSVKNQYLNTGAVFLGIMAGYILCAFIGKLDLSPVSQAGWFNLPRPFYFGFDFKWGAVLPFIVPYLVTTIETIGDLTATGEVSKGGITQEELRGGILADGVGSAIGGIFNGGANTTFSQNIGVIPLTGVASRYVVTLAGVILVLFGICPKLGSLVAIMPSPVLGGAGLMMFGMVAAAGISGLHCVKLNTRNLLVFTLALAAGLGVTFRPQILQHLSKEIQVFLGSGITTGTMVAVTLNLILPHEPEENLIDKKENDQDEEKSILCRGEDE